MRVILHDLDRQYDGLLAGLNITVDGVDQITVRRVQHIIIPP